VVSQGKIAQFGSHEGLMARGGPYADLYTIQASAYQ
jgi:ABC-type multidrug transport system fused ATPase/permease subunit